MDRLLAGWHRYDALMFRASARTAPEDVLVGTDPLPGVGGPRLHAGYAVRIAWQTEMLICPCCRAPFAAGGPTGFFGSLPICDACLLERAPQLGMVLVLIAVVRAFGGQTASSRAGEHNILLELGAFARLYERFASQHAPARGLETFLRDPFEEK